MLSRGAGHQFHLLSADESSRSAAGEAGRVIVDSHCHVGRHWYEPVESLLFQMDSCGVDRAVLVQSLAELDNSYQAECIARYPGRLASVVRVDDTNGAAADALVREAERGAVGVRLQPPAADAGKDQGLLWRTAEELGISVSCVGRSEQFAAPEFAELLASYPELPVVIEHLGDLKPYSPSFEAEHERRIMDLGRMANAYIKFHGLAEYARRTRGSEDGTPFESPVPNLVPVAIAAFGAEKVLWGSDYPIVSSREGYRNSLVLQQEQLRSQGDTALSRVFGSAALKLYWPKEA
jgi:L-fuconolactonase